MGILISRQIRTGVGKIASLPLLKFGFPVCDRVSYEQTISESQALEKSDTLTTSLICGENIMTSHAGSSPGSYHYHESSP